MRFTDIEGNSHILKALVGMADSARVPHAILFHENEGGGALAVVQAFLQYLNCPNRRDGDSCGVCPSCLQTARFSHPDIRCSFPIASGGKVSGESSKIVCSDFTPYWRELAGKNPYFLESELSSVLGIEKKAATIPIAEGRAIAAKLALAPVSGGYRAVVMYLPERMNERTANFLLKSMEEPMEKTLFLLISHEPEAVLRTISSRCLLLRVLPMTTEEVERTLQKQFDLTGKDAFEAAALSGGSVGEALYLLSEKKERNELERIFADLMESLLDRDLEGTLRVGEDISALDSREKQKAFCTFAGDCLRKIFMLQQGMEAVSQIAPNQKAYYEGLAAKLSPGFCKKGLTFLNRSAMMLERNVSQKMVFCNLVLRMYAGV